MSRCADPADDAGVEVVPSANPLARTVTTAPAATQPSVYLPFASEVTAVPGVDTFAPGMTAFVGSVTVPSTRVPLAHGCCAKQDNPAKNPAQHTGTTNRHLIQPGCMDLVASRSQDGRDREGDLRFCKEGPV